MRPFLILKMLTAQALSAMDEEDCGKRYLCELAAAETLDTEEQRTLSFFQVTTQKEIIMRFYK